MSALMIGPTLLACVRIAFGLLALVAIITQMRANITAGDFHATRFFAFFTIQSNLIGIGVLIASVLLRASPLLDWLRGAATVYLTVTFFIFIALLSDIDVQLVIPWVDFVLHKVMPIVIVFDWTARPPAERVKVFQALLWLAFPLVWLVLTLARGAIDGWYPYPFLDPAQGGCLAVFLTCVIITIGFILVGAIVMVGGNALRRRGQTSLSDRTFEK